MARYYLSGSKKISIHSDITDEENDKITYAPKLTEIEITDNGKITYGYNNRPYVRVKLNSAEFGYVFYKAIKMG